MTTVRQTQPTKTSPEWQSLLNVLLGDAASMATFSETDDEIIITPANDSVGERLTLQLSSPEQLQANLWYTLRQTSSPSVVLTSQTHPEPRPLDEITAAQIFSSLLDKDTSKRLGISDWQKVPSLHLFVDVISKEQSNLVFIRKAQIDIMRSCLLSASFAQLRIAISHQPRAAIVNMKDTSVKGPLAPIIDRLFVEKADNANGSIKFYFDIALLYQCIVAPELISKESRIFINKRNLINYLCSITQSGVLLERLSENTAKPVLFNTLQALAVRPHQHHVVMMDCSHSMAGNFNQHIEKVIEFIDNLREYDNTATIDIFPFQDAKHILMSRRFNINDKTSIDYYLKGLRADFGTNLYGTVQVVLAEIKYRVNENVCLYIFSDGCDDLWFYPNATSGLKAQTAGLARENNPPKVFVIQIGDKADVNATRLLTEATLGTAIAATSSSEFEKIYEHVKKINLPREIVTFIGKLANQFRESRIALYAGQPGVGEPITIPGEFRVVRGAHTTSYAVSLGAPQIQAAPVVLTSALTSSVRTSSAMYRRRNQDQPAIPGDQQSEANKSAHVHRKSF